MPPVTDSPVRTTPRRARLGVSLMFFTNGVLFSAFLPRLPEFKDAFDLSDSAFGLLVIAFPLGALLAAAPAGRVIRRFGTLPTNAVGSVLLAAAIAVAAAGGSVWVLAAALAVAGALDAIVDAAQNVQGVLAEQWRGRSVMNSFHAAWSAGAATGGVIGATAAATQTSPATQLLVNGIVWGAVAVLACRLAVVPATVKRHLRATHHPEHTATHSADQPADAAASATTAAARAASLRRHAYRLLVPLVVLAIMGSLVEDIANNWAVLFVGRETSAPTAVAGLALTVALLAQFVGRLLGDRMTDRWGRRSVARTGGVIIAVGALLVATSPAYPLALLGFALAGFGCATLVPAAFAAAGRIPGLPEGTGIALLGWLMRLGFLVTSPVVGGIADLTNLRIAMLIPVAGGLAAAGIAHSLSRANGSPAAGAPA